MPHGAPTRARRARDEQAPDGGRSTSPGARRLRPDADRFLLSTFGLISPGKGLETAIEALPAIVERHPEVPLPDRRAARIRRSRTGKASEYRLMLERRVVELDLGDHVEFDDRFLSIDELADLLAATDVFVTPYRNREQIASGALTFAIAAGCGVVSTPYWYAEDMLASGAAGSFRSTTPRRLADAVCEYVEQPERSQRRGPKRGGSARARVAVSRRGDRRRCCARPRARTAPHADPRRRAAAHERAQGPHAHARRRRRHRAARARRHPEPRQRLLRRRRRPPGRRLARARAARQRAGMDGDPLSRARLPARGARTRAACATS